jgi:hypothetical protein
VPPFRPGHPALGRRLVAKCSDEVLEWDGPPFSRRRDGGFVTAEREGCLVECGGVRSGVDEVAVDAIQRFLHQDIPLRSAMR